VHHAQSIGSLAGVLLAVAVVSGRQAPAPAPDLTKPAMFTDTAPATFDVQFDATFGIFIVRVTRAWAPHGADRFYNLVKAGFYNECRFHRVVPDSLVQFGIHGDPAVSAAWNDATLPVDRARVSNTRGRITYAMAQLPTTRTTQVFINFKDNSRLDPDFFAPFGEVITSMIVVEQVFDKYGEDIDPRYILLEGNAWLMKYAPRLDFIKRTTILAP
jgi:peptidyl-prolyl cis-trans isomerase A (cyclophilin A)